MLKFAQIRGMRGLCFLLQLFRLFTGEKRLCKLPGCLQPGGGRDRAAATRPTAAAAPTPLASQCRRAQILQPFAIRDLARLDRAILQPAIERIGGRLRFRMPLDAILGVSVCLGLRIAGSKGQAAIRTREPVGIGRRFEFRLA